MSEQSTTSRGRKPTHRLYRVEGQGEAAIWTPIGAAWPNRDGQGFNISCEAGPLQGRLVLRLITSKDTRQRGSVVTPSPSRQVLIRALNDSMRADGPTGAGRWVLTRGVVALGEDLVACVLTKVRAFDRFDADNDPHDEHDFGSFELCGSSLFWKIDYYDIDLEHGSEDPADATITTRVLTIMLAEEY